MQNLRAAFLFALLTYIMKNLFFKCSFAFLFTVNFFIAQAQGNLLVSPKRIVFEGNKRTEEVNLANIGKDTAIYAISFVQFKMDDNGNFVLLNESDSGYNFASKNIRYFPRTVTLAPNEAQSVRLQLIKTANLLPGEYRSHLTFKNITNNAVLGEESKPVKDSSISVKLVPSFGLSIPAIIRSGDGESTGTVSDIHFMHEEAEAEDYVAFTLHRKGNFSLYGDIKISFTPADNKETQELLLVKGLAVYTPNSIRKVKFNLPNSKTSGLAKGRLTVVYSNPAMKNAEICKGEITL